MKKILTTMMIVGFLCFSMFSRLILQAKASSLPPVGYWKFDEESGSVALDSSGNNNHGSIYGATWTSGKIGHALLFDGFDSRVEIPVLYSSSPSSLTVSAGINSPLSDIGYIVYHGDNGEFLLHNGERSKDGATGRYPDIASFSVKLTDGHWYDVYSNPLIPNVWHYLVGIWTKGVSLKIYVDGLLAGENLAIPDHHLWDPGGNFVPRVGVYSDFVSEPETFYDGIIDEVKIYNYAKTAEEIWNDYQLFAGNSEIPFWRQWWFWMIIALGITVGALAFATVHYRKKAAIPESTDVTSRRSTPTG